MTIDSTMIWIILGLVLLIAEMATGTFTLIFIALACFATALVSFFPGMDSNYTIQITTCSIVSVLGVVLLRKPLQNKMLKSLSLKSDIGKELLIDHGIHPHGTARIGYQGTTWQATNLDAEEMRKGDRVCIVGMDGNTLLIRKVF
ncbi:MAG: NfeD family protein [Proteobacteria bacterium]|nr:NfeD family protein [Pseudomonadota bacterium]